MTNEHIKTLEGLLSPPIEFQLRDNGVIAFRWNTDTRPVIHFGYGEPTVIATLWRLTDDPGDADVLYGEAERAILAKGSVKGVKVDNNKEKGFTVFVFMYDGKHVVADGSDKLEALLDAWGKARGEAGE